MCCYLGAGDHEINTAAHKKTLYSDALYRLCPVTVSCKPKTWFFKVLKELLYTIRHWAHQAYVRSQTHVVFLYTLCRMCHSPLYMYSHTEGLIELLCLSSVAGKKRHLCSNFNFIHYTCTAATHFIVQVHCRTIIEALLEQHMQFLSV